MTRLLFFRISDQHFTSYHSHSHSDLFASPSLEYTVAMFCVIGLGLYDEKDITVRGLEIVKKSSRVYLEAYTSILMVPKERLSSMVDQ